MDQIWRWPVTAVVTGVNALEGLVVGSIYLLPPDLASSIAESGDPVEKSGATRRRPAEGSMEFLMQQDFARRGEREQPDHGEAP